MGFISLSSILNAIIGITSYYCVILKMVILHDAIKNNSECFFCVYLKRTKTYSFLKQQKKFFFNPGGLFFQGIFLNSLAVDPSSNQPATHCFHNFAMMLTARGQLQKNLTAHDDVTPTVATGNKILGYATTSQTMTLY